MSNSSSVQLSIRSTTSQSDCKLDGSLDWSVLELKEHIEREWPSHPKPEDQRLVYAGKLLSDDSKLRDVLRLEDLPFPFIVHLVCRQVSPPSMSPILTPRQSADGIRRRINNSTSGASASSVSSPAASTLGDVSPTWVQPQGNPSSQDQVQGDTTNQVVGIEQIYAQYMQQYMHYLQNAGSGAYPLDSSTLMMYPWANAGHMPHQQQVDAAGNVLGPMAAAAAAMAGGQPAEAGHPGNAGLEDARAAANQPMPAHQGDPVGPNPGNVMMNPNAGGLGAVQDNDGAAVGPRDILDWIYVATRALVLLTLVFFYSTFTRLIMVAGVVLVVYLQRLGVFGQNLPARQQQRQEQARQAADQEGEQPEVEPPPVTNYLAVVGTFIATFFSSLIPQPPQVV